MQNSAQILGKRRRTDDGPKRSSVACDRCRSRKSRCTGNIPEPCVACVEAKQPCTYSESERKVTVPESYLHQLQAQARSNAPGLSPPDPPTNSAVTDTLKNVVSVVLDGSESWTTAQGGDLFFLGNSSSAYASNKLDPTSLSLSWHKFPHYDDVSWLRRNATLAKSPPLPPYEFAKRLYLAQHAYIGTIFCFIRDDVFHERLARVYTGKINLSIKDDCLEYCQIMLVFALGQLYSVNQWTGNDGPPGFSYFKYALELLPNFFEENSILFIETLSYVAYYFQLLNRRDSAYLYIGLALRMAISMGLHREVIGQDISPNDREYRRRVWWSTYSLERILCVTSGQPISIHDDEIDVLFPSSLTDENPRSSTILKCYTQLSKILGKISEDLYRRRGNSEISLAPRVQNIINSLSEWFNQLPEDLRVQSSDLEREVNRELVSLYLHYYGCVNMTARPLLLYAVRRHMHMNGYLSSSVPCEERLPPSMISVINVATAAARSSIFALREAAKSNLVATYGFIDGEQAFSSALLLVMANYAFPYKEVDAQAMIASLEVLQGMADRGNRYIQACRTKLTNFTKSINTQNHAHSTQQPAATSTVVNQSEPDINHGLEYNSDLQAQLPNHFPSALLMPTDPSLIDHYQNPFVPSFPDADFIAWTDTLDSIGIDMDREWIETALIADGNLDHDST